MILTNSVAVLRCLEFMNFISRVGLSSTRLYPRYLNYIRLRLKIPHYEKGIPVAGFTFTLNVVTTRYIVATFLYLSRPIYTTLPILLLRCPRKK